MKLSFLIGLTLMGLVWTVGDAYCSGDSLHYLTPQDTVMLEIAPDQRKFTQHTFAPRQTLYSLSRFYAQDMAQVLELNPSLAQTAPAIGQAVRIAVPNVAIRRYRTAGFRQNQFAPVCYRVRPGETAYGIAKTIFRMPVDTLLAVNGLSSTDLQPGQVLQVGWMDVSGAADKIKPRAMSPLQQASYRNYQRYKRQAQPQEASRMVARWTEGTGEASGKLFALVDGVAPGTILKVTNTANQKVAYVEVIGRPAQNTHRTQFGLQLSGTVARLLGAAPGNFYVLLE